MVNPTHLVEGQKSALETIEPCTTLEDIRDLATVAAREGGRRRLAVASAGEAHVVEAVARAVTAGWVEADLFGYAQLIEPLVETFGLPSERVRVHPAPSRQAAGKMAVEAVSSGACDILMKGNIQTSVLMKDVLHKDYGLRGAGKLSHVLAFDPPHLGRLLLMSDGALNIAPDLALKIEIVKNAVRTAHLLGTPNPHVALLSAIELVDPNQQASVDNAIIAKMADRGQIKGAKIDGPLALDNAIDPEAARIKSIKSEVAGRADVLIVHNVDVGNVFYKSLVYFSRTEVAGVITGGKAPIILTSRADSAQSKFNSVALGCVLAARESYVS
jgi:phosphate butyryltransferase